MFFDARTRSRRRDRESSVRYHVIIGVLACLLITALLFGLWYVTRLPSLTISDISIEGGETISHTQVRTQAESALLGAYMKLVPYRFFLTYPKDGIIASLMEIDRIKEVSVERVGRTALHISFTEYRPYALWCSALEEKAPCYFLDENGYAFAQSPLLQGGSLVRHVNEGETELSEKQVFDPSAFLRMHAFLDRLAAELNFRITDLSYTKEGDMLFHIHGGGKILTRNDGMYDTAMENLKTVLGSPAFSHIEPGNFQYIDVRFGNKVFVNEAPPPVETSTTTEETASTTALEQ